MPYWPSISADRIFYNAGIREIVNTSEKLTVTIDVSQFKPNELEVNVTGRVLTASGKHEERSDEHGSISRSFSRKYTLPGDVDLEQIHSKVVDGKLMIEAAKVGQTRTKAIPISVSEGSDR